MGELIAKIGLAIVTVILISVIVGLVISWPLQLLWNWLMPDIFGLGTITFWQAFGMYVLSSILFKSSNTKSSD